MYNFHLVADAMDGSASSAQTPYACACADAVVVTCGNQIIFSSYGGRTDSESKESLPVWQYLSIPRKPEPSFY